MKKYWLLKSEPSCYSIDDFAKDTKTSWTGIRNFQARNFMRDDMQAEDLALFYHSSAEPAGVFGIGKILGKGHVDETAFNAKDEHYDPKSKKENPTWYAVDVLFVKKLKSPVTLSQIKFDPSLEGILVASRGSRLSIQPVSEEHFKRIIDLGKRVDRR